MSISDVPPWRRYSRRKLRPDLSYPVKQTEVLEVLNAERATIGELILWWSIDAKRRNDPSNTHKLLKAEWTGDDTQLWVYAVPPELKGAAHALLTDVGLRRAAGWLREAPLMGNAWTATRRLLTVTLADNELQFVENMQPRLSD